MDFLSMDVRRLPTYPGKVGKSMKGARLGRNIRIGRMTNRSRPARRKNRALTEWGLFWVSE